MQKKPGQGESHLVVTLAGQTHPGQLGGDPAPDEGRRPRMGPRLAERLHGQPGPARSGGNRRRHPHHGRGGVHPRQRRSRACCGSSSRRVTASPSHGSRRPYWTAGVRREVLPNGLTLLVQQDRSAPVVAVVTHVKAGFFDEPDRWTGISHVLEHMFFKGTAAPRRRRDRPGDQERRRLSQRQHHLRPHLLLHRSPRLRARDRARHPVRRAPQLGHRRRRAGARAPGHHPGSQAQARHAVAPSPTRRCTR